MKVSRILRGVEWRFREVQRYINVLLARAGGKVYVGVHWPWPVRKPWQRRKLRLRSVGGGVGDELMCLPIIKEIKRRNPQCTITFVSRYVQLFEGVRDIDSVEDATQASRKGEILLGYSHAGPPPRSLITLMAECVGLHLYSAEVDAPRINAAPELVELIDRIGEPFVVIQPKSSKWTPNKNWPQNYWVELVKRLVERFNVVEVGTEQCFDGMDFGPRFRSLVGKTDVMGLGYVISRAMTFVGPPSGGMHLAHTFGVPAVIIFGGYESPDGYPYRQTTGLYREVACAPCWLTSPCPYGQPCLHTIQPEEVYSAVCAASAG